MPSELFYTINFSIFLISLIIGFLFSCVIIFIIAKTRRCHTVNNLLICDRCLTVLIICLLGFIGSMYGIRKDWDTYQPFCKIRGYLLMMIVISATYSFLIQAISRLFFAVFQTHRVLLTWRIHWIIILIKWLISILLAIQPFFIKNGFGLIKAYRMCGTITNVLSVALYTIIISFIIPGSIVTIVYVIILRKVRQSIRRVRPNINRVSSVKLHLKIMQDVLFILNIFMCGGTPFLVLTFWDVMKHESVPKELFFVSINSISLAAAMMMIVTFIRNKTVRTIVFR